MYIFTAYYDIDIIIDIPNVNFRGRKPHPHRIYERDGYTPGCMHIYTLGQASQPIVFAVGSKTAHTHTNTHLHT